MRADDPVFGYRFNADKLPDHEGKSIVPTPKAGQAYTVDRTKNVAGAGE